MGETVNLKVNSFDSEAGSFDLTGSGLESISCLGKSFSKSGQDLVADLSDCVSLASISKLEYCSDQDQIVATIKGRFHFDECCADEGRLRFDGMSHHSCEPVTLTASPEFFHHLDELLRHGETSMWERG